MKPLKTLFSAILLSLPVALVTTHAMAEKTEPASKQVSEQQVEQQVNVNTASAEALAKALKGVGLKKAEAIIKHREAVGGYKRIEQLLEVKGIGEATLEKNKAFIRL